MTVSWRCGWTQRALSKRVAYLRLNQHEWWMPHPHSSPCCFCGRLTGIEQYDLDRRVERLTVVRHDGQPVTSINISQSETVHAYCSEACWTAAEPALMEEFELRKTYPPFGFVSSCCCCGASVDRTHDYVCLNISTMTYSQDGSPIAICSDDRDWAVLCNGCDHPGGPESAVIANDVDTLVLEFS